MTYLARSIIRFNIDSVTSDADVPDKENMGLGRADGLISLEMKRKGVTVPVRRSVIVCRVPVRVGPVCNE
jgi:hypothetical protein